MSPAPDSVAAGYAACEIATRRAAANFGLGIRLLPPDRRRALSAIYWFAHRVDDAVDDGTARPAGRRARLDAARAALDRALGGDPADARWAALADAVRRHAIPPDLLHALVDGVARDLEPRPLPDWEAVRAYCWGVAGTVGLVSLRVFGGRGAAAERAAEDLGVALQLTNVLRDVRADAAVGRWYLPLDESERFGVRRADVAAGRPGAGWEALVAVQVERARALYGVVPRLLGHLPRSSRACPAALAGVYRGLLERIAADPRAPLRERVRLGATARAARGLAAATRAVVAP